MEKIVHLILKYVWYDLIDAGKKKVEYRDNTPHWHKRLIENLPDFIVFHRGYTSTTMKFRIACRVSIEDVIELHLGERADYGSKTH